MTLSLCSAKSSPRRCSEYDLRRALEEAYKVRQKPVGADMIENVLAKDTNALESRLTRQGYNVKVLAELLSSLSVIRVGDDWKIRMLTTNVTPAETK